METFKLGQELKNQFTDLLLIACKLIWRVITGRGQFHLFYLLIHQNLRFWQEADKSNVITRALLQPIAHSLEQGLKGMTSEWCLITNTRSEIISGKRLSRKPTFLSAASIPLLEIRANGRDYKLCKLALWNIHINYFNELFRIDDDEMMRLAWSGAVWGWGKGPHESQSKGGTFQCIIHHEMESFARCNLIRFYVRKRRETPKNLLRHRYMLIRNCKQEIS